MEHFKINNHPKRGLSGATNITTRQMLNLQRSLERAFIHNRFHLLISSGTVYSVLYSLERNGLIEGTWNERKRVYKLNGTGIRTIETVLKANDKIRNFITNILKVQSAL